MVYKKYVKKRGRSFGPYYYESYREGNKVKKIYIGGEKEYKEWIKKKKSVEQPSKKNKNLISRIQSASKNLLNIPSYAYQKSENSTNQKKQVYTISSKNIPEDTPENLTGITDSLLVYGEYNNESVEQSFDKENVDLEIKQPATFGDNVLSKNKNKRMEFNTSAGNVRLYFDLLNYSEFVENLADIPTSSNITINESVIFENQTEENITNETEIPVIESDSNITEIPTINETNQTINNTEINQTNPEGNESVNNQTIEENEGIAEESNEIIDTEEITETENKESKEIEETTEPENQDIGITGGVIKGISGFFSNFFLGIGKVTSRVIGVDLNETENIINNPKNNIESVDLEEIKEKIKELNGSEINEAAEDSIINAEEFDIIVNESENNPEESYKWGYKVKLNDLNFIAKVDVTTDQNITEWDNSTLRIGNNLLSFQDLVKEGYNVRFELPLLDINITNLTVIETNITEENITNITKTPEINEENQTINNESNETSLNKTETEGNTENITDNANEEEEITEETQNNQEAIDSNKNLEETDVEIEDTQPNNENEEIQETTIPENQDVAITGDIIKGIFGFTGRIIEDINNITENPNNDERDFIFEDIKYNNSIVIYIEKNFNNTNYSIGDIINLDPTFTQVINESNFTHLNLTTDSPYHTLLAYYPFDVNHTSDNITYDYSTNSYDGTTNTGSIVWNASCNYGACYTFDGTNDAISFPTGLSGLTLNNFTAMVWIRPTTTSTDTIFGNSANNQNVIRIVNATRINFVPVATATNIDILPAIVTNQWQHFAILRNTTDDVYVNYEMLPLI